MELHNLIIITVILIIIVLQVIIFTYNLKKMMIFRQIFPHDKDLLNISFNPSNYSVSGIRSDYQNDVFDIIIDSTNEYLSNNKGAVSDFHIIKDIVDRNCDSLEQEIESQIPIPLYLGLMGTMIGILVGVGFLVFSGSGLNTILTNPEMTGISVLLQGVALAMIASISGILLTTIGSFFAKNYKIEEESKKNDYLSWIQAKLLPNLSMSMTGTLERLTMNLASFNNTFSSNIKDLKGTLETVNQSMSNQAELIKNIDDLKIREIASVNITVYDKLKNCSTEIGTLGKYLQSTNEYLNDVRLLNENLDKNESRTKTIEEMGAFFKEEMTQIDQRKHAIRNSVVKFEEWLQQTLINLKDHTIEQLGELKNMSTKQQETFLQKLNEMPLLIDELRNLSDVKTSMINMEKAIAGQSRQMAELTQSIKDLAQTKVSGTSKFVIPYWLKITMCVGGGLIGLSALIYIIGNIVSIFSNII